MCILIIGDNMKSSDQSLMKRGYVEDNILSIEDNHTLLGWLTSTKANQRTIAIRTLVSRKQLTTKQLLELLKIEKALYTKIEICTCLQQGNSEDAKQMIPYLGTIGNNQLHSINKPSVKKSYPLPRDIIARTLAKMNEECIEVLFKELMNIDKNKVYELLDAIGWMLFYHPQSSKEYYLKKIKNIYFKYQEDDLMVWKICTCLSAFKTKESVELLRYVEHSHTHPMIKQEIKRSLSYGILD